MLIFPSTIRKPSLANPIPVKAAQRSTPEDGKTLTRPKQTAAKREIDVYWKALTDAERTILEAFFETSSGSSFYWSHQRLKEIGSYGAAWNEATDQYDADPVKIWTVTWSDDKLPFEWTGMSTPSGPIWSLRVTLLEI